MALNFKIDRYRNKDTLKIRLKGDLDASSAWQIINALKESCHGVNRIIIQTNYLNHIYPFGMDTLMHNFYLLNKPLRILSTDSASGQIILEFRHKNSIFASGYRH